VIEKAYHGGASWNAIGPTFDHLDRASTIISADVLDAWFDPSPNVARKIAEVLPFALKTSPPTHSEGLVTAISEVRGVPRDHVFVGGGSSDLMFALFPHLLRRHQRVLILDPMYGEYAHILEHVVGLTPIRHPLAADEAFAIDANRLCDQIRSVNPAMVVLVNPNSPTGQYWDSENIVHLARAFPETIFFVDETYIAYIEGTRSLEPCTRELPNVMVLTSMSKSYALSGARVGYLVAHPDVGHRVGHFIPPWSVSLIGQIAGIEALRDPAYYRDRYAETHLLRAELAAAISGAQVDVFPSGCNFLLVRLREASAARVVARARERGVYLRACDSMSTQFHDDFIRIAVKDRTANHRIADAVEEALG
jgi:histidinol-phosphate/aromatic aminotransferase/cobyric acid decarboxylase-like protein